MSFKLYTYKNVKKLAKMSVAFLLFLSSVNAAQAQTGQALDFDGVNDNVNLPLTFTGSYTKEAWINPTVLTGFPNIITGNTTAFFINNGQLAAGHDAGFNQVIDPTPLVAGTWYHIAVSYNAATQTMRLYKNGVQVASATGVPTYTETTQNLGIFAGSNFYTGKLDEVRIWNVERTATEIANYRNCELSGDEPFLIAYYNFNNGTANANNAGVTTLPDVQDKCVPANGTLQNFQLTGTTSNWVAPGSPVAGSCGLTAANIAVSGNTACITTGDVTPDASDDTYFGTYGGAGIDKVFTISNTGSATLTIGSIAVTGPDAAAFTITSLPAATLAPGSFTTFTVHFTPVGNGIRNATITINNSDADEATYNFAISATAAAVVPVTLQSFEAAKSGTSAKLTWKTSAELNNAGFEILRSSNGVGGWANIGYVAATNNATGSVYSFIDPNPGKGISVYRLRQVDINGNIKLSETRAVNFAAASDNYVSFYPNPVVNKLTLTVTDNSMLNTEVKINNANGAVVSRFKLNSTQQEVDFSNMSKGIYFISFSNGKVEKIIKQ
ncbi:MAG: hypothetical protein JWQ27_2857 [Ferruginibacter sp.]|nr:hypothetical protein [Ferruginibacter sp.]